MSYSQTSRDADRMKNEFDLETPPEGRPNETSDDFNLRHHPPEEKAAKTATTPPVKKKAPVKKPVSHGGFKGKIVLVDSNGGRTTLDFAKGTFSCPVQNREDKLKVTGTGDTIVLDLTELTLYGGVMVGATAMDGTIEWERAEGAPFLVALEK